MKFWYLSVLWGPVRPSSQNGSTCNHLRLRLLSNPVARHSANQIRDRRSCTRPPTNQTAG
ncbi:unnamed protein product [Nesidiocoris tenuis]|uniref:Uncharacterized protein n=1 Tax=Nesidiocoris tenuis TaxID=355587 RepID=A0A6H5FWY5_9HEMI|nr:unnamed protein product [Nesidiocoris tenuis]